MNSNLQSPATPPLETKVKIEVVDYSGRYEPLLCHSLLDVAPPCKCFLALANEITVSCCYKQKFLELQGSIRSKRCVCRTAVHFWRLSPRRKRHATRRGLRFTTAARLLRQLQTAAEFAREPWSCYLHFRIESGDESVAQCRNKFVEAS